MTQGRPAISGRNPLKAKPKFRPEAADPARRQGHQDLE